MNKYHLSVQFVDLDLNCINFLQNILNDILIKNKKNDLHNYDFLQEKLELILIKLDNTTIGNEIKTILILELVTKLNIKHQQMLINLIVQYVAKNFKSNINKTQIIILLYYF